MVTPVLRVVLVTDLLKNISPPSSPDENIDLKLVAAVMSFPEYTFIDPLIVGAVK